MMRIHPRGACALSVLCVLMLAGCASHPQRAHPSTEPAQATPKPAPAAPAIAPNPTGTPPDEQLPPAPGGMVGVPSCDRYLSTYEACHRAAGIFEPGQIDAHYRSMRDALLRDARDPVKRATLDQRCRALSAQLQGALHGRSCHPAQVPAASSG